MQNKERDCQECSECCNGTLIFSSKDAKGNDIIVTSGNRCHKLVDGLCSIYEDRPSICEHFHCLWLRQPHAFGEYMRPDRCGFIITTPKTKEGQKSVMRVIQSKNKPIDAESLIEVLLFACNVFKVNVSLETREFGNKFFKFVEDD